MTYEERSKWYCDKCSLRMKPVACGYLMRNMQDDCIELDNFMSGWELGQQDTIEEIEKALKQAKLYSDLSCKSRLYDDLVNLVEQLKK